MREATFNRALETVAALTRAWNAARANFLYSFKPAAPVQSPATPLACCRKGGPRRTDPAKVRSLYVTVRTGAALPRLTVLRNNEDQVGCGSSFRGATRRRSVYFGHKGRTEDRGSS